MDIRELISLGKSIYEIPLRVCYYARVSTDHELQSTSIVNQVDYFFKYINSVSCWSFIRGYMDEGISGKNVLKRENFLRMIEDGKRGDFDFILTKSVSRFARNTIDSIWYTNLLLQCGIGVFFLNDNINTFYNDSEFRLTLMASIAQDELRKLSESVQFGLHQSIQRGVVLGNSNILGYVKVKGKLRICEEEACIVRDIFDWFVMDKYNYREVGDLVFEKYQKKLDSTGIRRILTNYKYKGYYCGGKTRVIDYKNNKRKQIEGEKWVLYPDYDKVPPIVEEEVWNRVQAIILSRKRNCKKRWKVICMNHNKEFLYKRRKYKDKYYGYYICSQCGSLSEEILKRMDRVVSFYEVLVLFQEEDILLRVK